MLNQSSKYFFVTVCFTTNIHEIIFQLIPPIFYHLENTLYTWYTQYFTYNGASFAFAIYT